MECFLKNLGPEQNEHCVNSDWSVSQYNLVCLCVCVYMCVSGRRWEAKGIRGFGTQGVLLYKLQ